jgi:hypothetical protein
MNLPTSEFGRALEEISEGRQSLDSLLTILRGEQPIDDAERAERQRLVQALRESGRLSETASGKVMRTIFHSPEPPAADSSQASAPRGGSHPSNWAEWAENHPAAAPLTAGCVLRDRFVLEEVIGSGGMSVVFRALDRRREEAQDRQLHVAIKVLGDEFKRHPDALRALQRESRKTQRLAHPNIASVYDFDRDGSNVYMVMELLVGEPLDELLRRRGGVPLERSDAMRKLREMGAALSHAHGLGIVHSDFKPSNAFVTRSGETKLIDFGVARATKSRRADSQTVLTVFDAGKLGAMTLAYCSPEQMLGDADPDPMDDVYALGVVAYELLSGRHPFLGRSALEAQHKRMVVEPINGLSAEQNAALRAALAFHREERTTSVDELLHGLCITRPATDERGTASTRSAVDGTEATRQRITRDAGQDSRRQAAVAPAPLARWRLVALAAVLLAALGAVAYYGFHQRQLKASEELAREREAEQSRRAAAAAVESERLALEKAEQERLAAEAEAERLSKARARAKAEKQARAEAAAALPSTVAAPLTVPEAEADLQRALAAEEQAQSSPAAAATPPPPRTALYRWQDDSGVVHYGAEVPAEYKDSAVVMLPGE